MKHNILAWLPLAAALMTGCSQDLPFPDESGEGYLNRGAMAVDFKNQDYISGNTRAVDMGDFRVDIVKKGGDEIVKSYQYREMPEIIALPVGEYTVHAVYGSNPDSEWEAPHYKGNSDFTIENGKVTEDIEPVVCTLANIRVKIKFDQEMTDRMSPDSKVTVSVGQRGQLDFTKADEDRAGYFAYAPGSQTITAHFSGTVDGVHVEETKAYDNADAGKAYNISFNLHSAESDDPGSATGSVTIDASVTPVDITQDINPDDEYESDDMRPVEDPDTPGPGPDDPAAPAPTITAEAPIELGVVNDVKEGDTIVLNIVSEAEGGITDFKVVIDSGTLTPDELESVGLGAELDLVNPGSFGDALVSLGLPCYVGGKSEVKFDISGFIPLLNLLEPDTHKFHLTVSDANGTSKATLIIRN